MRASKLTQGLTKGGNAMSANPYKLHEEVDGDIEIEKVTTKIISHERFDLKWREIEQGLEVLTLNEILEQAKNARQQEMELLKEINPTLAKHRMATPYMKVWYETGMWGVIFEVGNYREKGDTWLVHGITKGYA